jgi:hypothetical protein
MQLILARKTVGDRRSRISANRRSMLYGKRALQVIALLFICVAISV